MVSFMNYDLLEQALLRTSIQLERAHRWQPSIITLIRFSEHQLNTS